MANKHSATDSRGQVHKRISASRLYSHAIVMHYNAKGDRPARSRACWSSRLDLAQTAAQTEGKYADAVEIVPATVTTTKPKTNGV